MGSIVLGYAKRNILAGKLTFEGPCIPLSYVDLNFCRFQEKQGTSSSEQKFKVPCRCDGLLCKELEFIDYAH